jgi:hypothetical protein
MRTWLGCVVCLALGFFDLGFEASHGVHALYELWYCITPVIIIGIGPLLGAFDVRCRRVL